MRRNLVVGFACAFVVAVISGDVVIWDLPERDGLDVYRVILLFCRRSSTQTRDEGC